MTNHALTLQLLAWIDAQPRRYAETIATWGSSCPRLTIFEDAQIEGLVEVVASTVALTDAGRQVLARTGEASPADDSAPASVN